MTKEIYLIGAGGHARSLLNLLELNHFQIAGVFDENYSPGKPERISGYPLIGRPGDSDGDKILVLAIGDNHSRARALMEYHDRVEPDNIVHPSAIIENRVSLGKYNQVFARTYFNNAIEIGDNNIINTGCILEHEVRVGSHNHLSVGSILCGRVTVGDRCFIGAGSVIIDKVKVCSGVIVGANSVVIRDIAEPGTYVGCPVRKVK
jgi:sugar O-acyltransferase (sialic acid O-acetyltransferase NeuD family)